MIDVHPPPSVVPVQRVQTLRKHFESGATLSYATRRDALRALGLAITRNEGAILEAMRLDMGKPVFEAYMTEIGLVRAELAHTLKHLGEWMRTRSVSTPLSMQVSSSAVHAVPLGVVLIIAPWNYPLHLVMSPLVAAIAAGNCAVVKPSEDAPHTAALAECILREALPPELVMVVQGSGATVIPHLMEGFRFDRVFFTGSPAVGAKVAAMAAPELIPVTLELGGKSYH